MPSTEAATTLKNCDSCGKHTTHFPKAESRPAKKATKSKPAVRAASKIVWKCARCNSH